MNKNVKMAVILKQKRKKKRNSKSLNVLNIFNFPEKKKPVV